MKGIQTLSIGFVSALGMLGLALGAGMRINGSHSFPVGLWTRICSRITSLDQARSCSCPSTAPLHLIPGRRPYER